MNWILFCFREHLEWDVDYIAKKLSISRKDYENLEAGFEIVDSEMAIEFSKLFNAPPQLFVSQNTATNFSIIYSNCHFENSNGYVNNLSEHQRDSSKIDLILSLKEEVLKLRKENRVLLEKLANT
jgi:plasmid maintenance system antidote protein VapI